MASTELPGLAGKNFKKIHAFLKQNTFKVFTAE